MKTRVTAGLDQTEQDRLNNQWDGSGRLRKRICELLQDDIDTIHAAMRAEEGFVSPSWALNQASKIGEVKALLKFISLLS